MAPTKQRPKQPVFKIAHCHSAVYGNGIYGKFPLDSPSLRLISNGTQKRTDLISDNPSCTPCIPALPLICIDALLSTAWLHGGHGDGRAACLEHSPESAFMLRDERSVERPTTGTINPVARGPSTGSRIARR